MSLARSAFTFASRTPFLLANMNESYKAELLVIDVLSHRRVAHPKTQKILSVGSSGETALALCSHPCVKKVYCCEWRENQSHLIELRRTSLLHLSMDEIRLLYGVTTNDEEREAQTPQRLAIFDRIVKRLPAESYDFWMKHRETAVKYGLMHTGKYEAVFSNIRKNLYDAGFEAPVENFQKYGGDEQFYKALTYTNGIKGPSHLSEEEKTMQTGISSLLKSGLQRMYQAGVDISKNYLVTLILKGTFAHDAGDSGFPLILTEQGQRELLRHGIAHDRLHILPMNVFEFGRKERYFDLITVSNIYDYMLTEAERRKALTIMKDSLTEGGLMLIRNSFGKALRHHIADVGLKVDEELSTAASEAEDSAFLGKFGFADSLLVLENQINLDIEIHGK